MQPATEYVPEVRKSRPTWIPNSKLPDYGPVIDEPLAQGTSSRTTLNHTKKYNTANLSTPQHPSQSSSMNLMYWIQSNPMQTRSKPQAQSSQRAESLYAFMIHTTTKVSPKENGSKGSSRGSPISATSATLSINSGMTSRKQHLPTINHLTKTLSPYCNPNWRLYQMKAPGSMQQSSMSCVISVSVFHNESIVRIQ
jgi:hypothetical protein